MTERSRIHSGSPYEETYGFSRAMRIGDRVVIAGTAPIWPDGSCDPRIEAQARRCFDIISRVLDASGASVDDLVRTRIYLTDGADADVVGRLHNEYFGKAGPVATMVVVAGLIDPQWRIEVEAEAQTR